MLMVCTELKQFYIEADTFGCLVKGGIKIIIVEIVI